MILRTWLFFVLTTAVAVVSVAALYDVVPAGVSSALVGMVVMGAGIGAKVISSRRRRALRADQPDGLERQLELHAAAGTLPVSLLVLLALGAWLLVNESFGPAGLVYIATALTVLSYWINYARLRRKF